MKDFIVSDRKSLHRTSWQYTACIYQTDNKLLLMLKNSFQYTAGKIVKAIGKK